MARNDDQREQAAPSTGRPAGDNAVERSLEDFIARANTTLPPMSEAAAAAVRTISRDTVRRRGKGKKEGTLVVIGSEKPLAEVTEIVTRLPAGTLDGDEPVRRGWFSLRLGLAFAAGAAAVLLLTRFLTGSPEPMRPVVTTPPIAAPPIVVEPIPVPAPTPVPLPEAAPPTVAAETIPTAAVAPAPPAPARKKPARKPDKAEKPKKPSGLVDPFAE